MRCFAVFVVLLVAIFPACLSNSTAVDISDERVRSCRRQRVLPQDSEQCCEVLTENFKQNWSKEGNYLTEHLAALRLLNCSQYAAECAKPSFNFTAFTHRVYQLACNFSRFQDDCGPQIYALTPGVTRGDWTGSLMQLWRMELSYDELAYPCVQAALYDAVSAKRNQIYGYYHETKREFLPFCGISWCGVNSEQTNRTWISAWLCMSSSCQKNVIAVVVVCSIIAAVGFVENLLILFVYARKSRLRASQCIYRLSLSVSDLLCSAIVFPTFANSLYKVSTSRETMGRPVNQTATSSGRFDSVARLPGGDAWSHLDQSYLDFVGFFTSLYITVTIYVLAAASIERLLFYRRYFAYSRENAKKFALRSIFVSWLLACVVSVPSLVVNRYSLIASVLVLSSGATAVYLYVIAFFLPIIAMWALSLTALCLGLKQARAQRENNCCARLSNELQLMINEEGRKARTLNIMVASFSVSVILGSISALSSFFVGERPDGESGPDPSLEFVAVVFLVCNCLWNFWIYMKRDLGFKTALRRLFCCKNCRDDEASVTALSKNYAQMDKRSMGTPTSEQSCTTSPL